MKNILLLIAIMIGMYAHSQYYYNDIVGTRETNRQMQTYLAQKVRTVAAIGIDQRGVKATDFSEYQELKENGRALKATTIANLNKTVIYSRFDEQGRVISMTDSSTALNSITTYSYDAAGRISRVQNTVRDSANDFNQVETHDWIYSADGKPKKMWRLISNSQLLVTDSLEIRFVTDEDGNPGEERTFRNGHETGYVYYYFDDKNRLSDIVRFNTKLKKLLPDLMFEYDDQDRVIQKIMAVSNVLMGHFTWRYIYNDKGLKTKEALFDKDKMLTGRIDYSYSFSE
jgi:YD repeat-containing protein